MSWACLGCEETFAGVDTGEARFCLDCSGKITDLHYELNRLQNAIREHRDQKGHDRCWLDDQKLYSVLPEEAEYNPKLPPRLEFLKNCERFYDSRQGECPKLHEWGDSEIEKKRQWARRWKRLAKKQSARIKEMGNLRDAAYIQNQEHESALIARIYELNSTINHPVSDDFIEGMRLEIAYQQGRWKETDPQKTETDWFWLIGYLAGKALWNPEGDIKKKRHRIITVAAAAANWWNSLRKSNGDH